MGGKERRAKGREVDRKGIGGEGGKGRKVGMWRRKGARWGDEKKRRKKGRINLMMQNAIF